VWWDFSPASRIGSWRGCEARTCHGRAWSNGADRLALTKEVKDRAAGLLVELTQDPECKESDAMLARIHPIEENFWDIRSISPRPGIRAFAAFSGKDELVVLTWEYRENLVGRREWEQEIERFKTAWRDLFGTETPFRGSTLDEYLSHYRAV
jgi:hypothetical protein